MPPKSLRLKKHEDRRLHTGHTWVFSNEVDTKVTPLDAFEPGEACVIEEASGRAIGSGYVNPATLISARLVSRDPTMLLDQSLITHRLNVALSLRERLFDKPYYRLVFGDSDGLPGLVVDRFADVLVVQITTAGMERLKAEVIAALDKVMKPRAILLRNDSSMRAMENLPSYIETVHGEIPEWLALEENGLRFETPLARGQKTGWFFDHRMNRARAAAYVKGKRVLDVFSYLGAWGVQAAAAGAESVLCVDSSALALEGVVRNAGLNNVEANVQTRQADAFDLLKELRAAREKFDVVILDPPALIKRRKDIKEGTLAYQRLNQMAMQVLAKDGILVSCSCSYHLERDTLRELLLKNSRHLDRFMQIVEEGHQGPDHP
ncbi:MAG TPA: class I SAM-dependent rRNA methyltransferase, partial [Acidiferrobacterales bacterium]|nr:class I SAM-dependent rRNA methyltransferase [Acidiferrobacterales bacterium]